MSHIEVFCCLFCVTLLLVIIYFLIKLERVLVQDCREHIENYEHLVKLINSRIVSRARRSRIR